MRNLKLDKKIFNLFLFLFVELHRNARFFLIGGFSRSFFSERRVRRLKNRFAIVQGQLPSSNCRSRRFNLSRRRLI